MEIQHNNPISRSLAKKGAWAVVGQILSTIFGLLHISILARLLSPDEMGVYFLIFSIGMLLSILGAAGNPETQVRLISQYRGSNRFSLAAKVAKIGLANVLVISIIVATLSGYALSHPSVKNFFNYNSYNFSFVSVSFWIIFSSLQASIVECFRGMHDIKKATLFGNFGKNFISFFLTLIALLTVQKFTLGHAFSIIAIASLLNVLLGWAFLKNQIRNHSTAKTETPEIWPIALPLCMNMLLIITFTRFGVWALGATTEAIEIALFGSALQLVSVLAITLTIVNAVVPPIIANKYFNSPSHSELQSTLRSLTTIASGPALLVFSLIFLFGKSILVFAYGPSYIEAYQILLFLALGSTANVFVGPCGTVLKMTGNQKLLLKINFIFGLLSAALIVFAALKFGAVGVAAVTGIMMTLKNIFMLVITIRNTGLNCATFVSIKNVSNLATSLRKLVSTH